MESKIDMDLKNTKRMKFYKIFTSRFLLLFLAVGCSLEAPIESTITEFAEFEMTGGTYVYVEEGTPFVEPGIAALAGGESLEVETSGTVDENTPGVYVLTYSAVNADGFPATATRYVAVGNSEVALNRNLSGTYLTGTRANTLTQIAPGFYLNSDTLPNNSIQVFMADLGNGQLIIPPQSSRFGTVYADPSIDPASFVTLTSDATSFTIAQFISCCGIFTRTFIKQ